MSRKRAKSRTRGRKVHSTEAKARGGRARKTSADLERQLKACKRQIAQARERLAEATLQQTATSEMLRLISNSPIQSVLDAVAEHAARLCDASNARIWRLEDDVLRLVASYGESSATMDGREGLPVDRDTVTGRAACDRRTFHVHDIAAEDSEYPLGSRLVKGQGWHTTLATPLLREGTPIGTILVRRTEVRPFSDKQIALLETFAAQAAIAIENVRLFEAEKQRTLALAHANRDLAEREAKIRRLVDSNIIGIFIWDFDGRILEANDAFLGMVNYDREDLVAGRIYWSELTPPDWRDRNNLRIKTQKSSGHFPPFEKEYTRKDGTRVPVLMGGAIFEEGGTQGMAYVLDLTERKKAEDRLRRSEAYLADSQRLSHTGTAVFNATTGQHVYWSDENYRIWALDPLQGLPGHETVRQRIHPDDQDAVWQKVQEALRQKKDYSGEFRIVLPNGTVKYLTTNGHHLFSTNGELVEVIATSVDVTDHKRADQALRESEYKLRQIIETVPAFLWSTGPDGEPTHISQRILDYSGMRLEDFKRGGWEAFVHPADFPETVKALEHAIQTGTSYEAVHRLRRATDGEYRWYHARGEPLRDREGRIVQWYGLSVDIDERKKAEDRLRRSEAYLAEAQRLSHTGTSVFNKTTVLYWSEETYRMWGFDPLQGVPSREAVRQRMHPDDWDRVEENIASGVREKRSVANEFRIILPDGTVKHVEATNHPVFSASGELLEIIGTGVDVTERKRSEQALREREAKIRRLVDSNIIGIFVWDFDGRILEANEAFLHIVGYDHEDLVAGRIRWTELTPPEWRDRDTRLMQEHEVTGSLPPFEKEYFRKDGSRVPVLIGVATFEEGGHQGVAFVLDLTERKRAEERLQVQHTVAQILAEAATIEEATPRILLAMGECLGWDVGALWRVDREAEALRCVELWHKASIEVPEFERVSREFTFGPGVGLPGRVWSSLEPEYIPDVVPDDNFPRAPIAEQEGLHAALGFPILLGGEVLGVIEFFSREIRQPDQELLNVLATIGSQIGQFIERKRGEQALRESETKIRRLVDANIIGIFIWDFDGRIVEANDAFLRLLGYDHEDIVSGRLRWADLTPPEWRVTHEGRLAGLKATGSLWPYEKEYFRKDGSRVPVLTGGATFEEGGSQGVAFVLDLTERKRAEQVLRDSERNARSAIDGIAGLVAIFAPNGELDALNRQVIEYFGRSLEEMKDWGTSDAVHPEDRPRIAEIFQRSMATGTPFHYEIRLRRFDGEYRWFDNRCVPIRDGSGRIVRWYMLGTDIEDRKQALARLEQMQTDFAHMNRVSMMGELAASLSHEISQPIASARNNARAAQNFLDRQPPDLSEVREALDCVVGDTDRAGDIVDRIRANIKKTPPRKDHFDLNQAIDEVLLLAQSAMTENEVSVRTRFAEGPLVAYGDRVQLQQVILNLVLNAVEAMASIEARARLLLISTEQNRADEVLVAIRDSGPGIEPDHLERVFEAFYTTKSNGVGMGLSICRSIIGAQGGRLWAETKKPGGAVFLFTLPSAENKFMNSLRSSEADK